MRAEEQIQWLQKKNDHLKDAKANSFILHMLLKPKTIAVKLADIRIELPEELAAGDGFNGDITAKEEAIDEDLAELP